MTRLNLLVLGVLVLCAMSVVTSNHQWRKAFIGIQSEKDLEAKLDQEWRELQIESQTLGTHKRIEQKATRELGMQIPDAKKAVIVVLDAQQSAGAVPAASSGAGDKK
jgi:cell division protein FtsL